MKKFRKTIQRGAARGGMYFFAWLFSWVPFPVIDFIFKGLLALAFVLTKRHRKIAEESVDIAFAGEKSEKEREHIVKKCYEKLGRGIIEMLCYMAHPDQLNKMVEVEGLEHLDAAFAKGKGVVAVTGHYGNFPLMMLYLAHKGYPTSCIIRPMRDDKMEAYVQRQRIKHHLNTVYSIPRKECVMNSLKVLKKNELLFVPVDQNLGSTGGVDVNFFGRKASTATGPVVFAQRTGATILPVFIFRTDDRHHRIVIEPPYELQEAETEQEKMEVNMQAITDFVEKYIRAYPDEWAWIHRRWGER